MKNELFCTRGNAPADQPRLYEGCGLDNIWLVDGFEVVEYLGEETVQPEDVEELHRAIALHLIMSKKALGGSEIKFIRRAIDMTQAELAHRLSVTYQTVARWEKDKVVIPGPEDLLLRINTILAVSNPESFARLIEEMPKNLQELDEGPSRPARFTHNQTWVEAELEAA